MDILSKIQELPESELNLINEILERNGIDAIQRSIDDNIDLVFEALQIVLGVTVDDMKSKSSKKFIVYARLILYNYIRTHAKRITHDKIGAILEKPRSIVTYSLIRYDENMLKNEQFKKINAEFKRILNRLLKDF